MKKIIFTVLVFLAFASNLKAQSGYDFYDTCVTGQRLYFSILSDNSVAVVNGECDYYLLTGDMEIPSEVVHDGISYLVTYIGGGAFMNCSGLTSVNIPNSVTSIGGSAFGYCTGLISATLSNSISSIGQDAFVYCTSITSMTLPNSITSIGDGAFMGCSGLTSVNIPNSITSIGDGAFIRCSGLTSIVIEPGNPVYDSRDNCNAIIRIADNTLIVGCQTTVIPNSVTSIGGGAFEGCTGLTSLNIPNSVTSIGGAFSGCSGLTSVNIPNSITSIGDGAFIRCSGLTSIVIEPGNPVYDSRDNCNAIIRIADNTLIVGCQTTVIPNSVTSIGDHAFYGCSGLTSLTIPNSVTSIGDYAFYGCSGLTSLTIPNSVTSIGDEAFYGCSGLTSLTIPNSVTSITSYDFRGCSNLTTIIVESGNPVYDSRDNCNAIIRIADNTLIVGCQTTVIPNSVTSIGDYAFYGCSGLTSLTIPNSVTSIGDYAFYGCSGLTSLTIPNSVTSIGDYAFYGCSGFTSLTIPNSVTFIGDFAFNGCSGLTSLTIPNSVTSITSYDFRGCSNLTTIIVEPGNPIYDSRDNCNAIIRTADNKLIFGCQTTVIPNSVTSIGDEAFYGCSGLTSLTIPNSVTSIGYRAFYGCSGMTSLTIPNSVTSIGGAAFSGCSGLITIIFEGTIPPTLAGCFSTTFPVSNDLTIYVPEGSQEDYEASFGPAASNITIIESNVGIENLDYTSAMNVYPNPTTGIVNVECTMNNVQVGTLEFHVFDAFGRWLRSTDGVETQNFASLQTVQIDLSRYASGVYFVKAVADGNVVAVKKVVKQ